jgi:hypothetical protein
MHEANYTFLNKALLNPGNKGGGVNMGLFLKKRKLTVQEAGRALLVYLNPSRSGDEAYSAAEKQLNRIKGLGPAQIPFELYCLKIFAVDFMIRNVFGDRNILILDSFHEAIEALCNKKDPQMCKEIEIRSTGYSVEVTTYYNEVSSKDADMAELAHIIGGTFSNYLAREGNAHIIHIGETYFTESCKTLKDVLHSFKII